jgi:hypothetical protein
MNVKIEIIKKVLKVAFLFFLILAALTAIMLIRQAFKQYKNDRDNIALKEKILVEMIENDKVHERKIKAQLEKFQQERTKKTLELESEIGSSAEFVWISGWGAAFRAHSSPPSSGRPA